MKHGIAEVECSDPCEDQQSGPRTADCINRFGAFDTRRDRVVVAIGGYLVRHRGEYRESIRSR